MRSKQIFVTIEFDYVPGIFDYPQNVPMPQIGEHVIFETKDTKQCYSGRVYDLRHNVSDTVFTAHIKVNRS